MKHIKVTAAVLVHDNEILCMQRGPSKYDYIAYKYEFPGGKVEEGETDEASLMRELREEMVCYLCPVEERTFTRKEHIAHQWLPAHRLGELDWAEADKPIVEKLMAMFSDRRG